MMKSRDLMAARIPARKEQERGNEVDRWTWSVHVTLGTAPLKLRSNDTQGVPDVVSTRSENRRWLGRL